MTIAVWTFKFNNLKTKNYEQKIFILSKNSYFTNITKIFETSK